MDTCTCTHTHSIHNHHSPHSPLTYAHPGSTRTHIQPRTPIPPIQVHVDVNRFDIPLHPLWLVERVGVEVSPSTGTRAHISPSARSVGRRSGQGCHSRRHAKRLQSTRDEPSPDVLHPSDRLQHDHTQNECTPYILRVEGVRILLRSRRRTVEDMDIHKPVQQVQRD